MDTRPFAALPDGAPEDLRREARPASPAAVLAAEARVETLLARVEAESFRAERRVAEAARLAEQTLAVAAELRDDVSSLIEALQGLAAEVGAQMRDHTAGLMAGLASSRAGQPQQSADASAGPVPPQSPVARNLGRKAAELRSLLAETEEVLSRLEPAYAGVSRAPGQGPRPRSTEQEYRALDAKASGVEDEVSVGGWGPGAAGGRYARAVELAQQGMDCDAIARSCGLGREEVRMLLRLRSGHAG